MNCLKVIPAVLLFLGISQAKAQSTPFKSPDKTVQCKNIKEGKFLRNGYPEEIWYMTVKDNVQTEYFNGGKNFIKSTLVFVDDCNYKAIVMEKTVKSTPIQIGDVFNNTITETEKNALKIQSKIDKKQFELVLVKVK
ncbi:hypothetical protein HNP38_000870 [Chryseobacterium defluvii]|uniref:Lipocalin-like protein n=1 Tax=Chryseobacterium defluvii TaxID=160396 RepID=A0A840KC69_9FLAO|nr:hypothetical protein [Chryseobacterium defluvii]MBB4805598.1 hypothetical protein [Chryseobacterium defluvii]